MAKNMEQINATLREWQDENSDNRAYIVLAVEKGEEHEDGYEMNCAAMVGGDGRILTDVVCNAMDTDENPVGTIIKGAIKRTALRAVARKMGRLADELQNLMDDEQGAEQDKNDNDNDNE